MVAKTMEKHVSDLAEVAEDIPRLINMRFTYIRLHFDALDARVGTVEAKLDALRAEVRELPRIFAKMLDEREKRGR
jgi:hypothetical protein